jgi:hypothetical protein
VLARVPKAVTRAVFDLSVSEDSTKNTGNVLMMIYDNIDDRISRYRRRDDANARRT